MLVDFCEEPVFQSEGGDLLDFAHGPFSPLSDDAEGGWSIYKHLLQEWYQVMSKFMVELALCVLIDTENLGSQFVH